MYLIHVPLMMWSMAFWNHRQDYHFISITTLYLGFVLSSLLAAVGLYLLVEKPCSNLIWEWEQVSKGNRKSLDSSNSSSKSSSNSSSCSSSGCTGEMELKIVGRR